VTAAAFLLALASSVIYGTADFLGGYGARRASAIWVVAISQAAGLLMVAAAMPFFPAAIPSGSTLWWSIAAGVTGGGGVALLYRALAIGLMSVVAPTTAVCAIAIPVVVGFLLGERPGMLAVLGIVVAMIAIILVSRGDTTHEAAREPLRALILAMIAGVMIGLFLVSLDRAGSDTGLWPLLIARVVSVTFFGIAAFVLRRTHPFPDPASLRIIVISGLIDMVANILYLLAVRRGSLSLVATLTSLYPAATVILARYILQERLTRTQWTGVACAAAAILLIVQS
jgi:drug/metabolite transporter (DMT)-like permease